MCKSASGWKHSIPNKSYNSHASASEQVVIAMEPLIKLEILPVLLNKVVVLQNRPKLIKSRIPTLDQLTLVKEIVKLSLFSNVSPNLGIKKIFLKFSKLLVRVLQSVSVILIRSFTPAISNVLRLG